MDKTLHRVISTPHRGQRMAVSETVACAGPGAGAQPGGTPQGRPGTLVKPLSLAMLLAFGGAALIEPAHAQSIRSETAAAPATQQPGIGQASNGIPLVNIQKPSSAGVSMNQYSQFNVDARGAILNNSSQGAQTQLAGTVQANPNLAQGQARIIVNQVNNAAPSQLKGPVEVAGQRADVIIANPSGIVVNGGKFINAAGVTLSAGMPVIENGQVKGYQVRQGSIAIEGQGLDTQDADYTRILAYAAQVNAVIKAQDLQIVTGVNDLDAQGQIATAYAQSGKVQGIDTGALGGMYANKITLVSTAKGVGVNNAGQIHAGAGGVSIDAQGNLVNSASLSSQGPVSISTQGLENKAQGTLIAGELRVRNQGKLSNQGKISAGRLDVETNQFVNQGEVSQTGAADLNLVAARGFNPDEGVIGGLLKQLTEDANSSGQSANATPGQLIVLDDFDNTSGLLSINGRLTLAVAAISSPDADQAVTTAAAPAYAAAPATATATATAKNNTAAAPAYAAAPDYTMPPLAPGEKEWDPKCGYLNAFECGIQNGTMTYEQYKADMAQIYGNGGKAASVIGTAPLGGANSNSNPNGTNPYWDQSAWGADMLNKPYVQKWEILAYQHTTQPYSGGALIGIGTNTSNVYMEVVKNPFYTGKSWETPIYDTRTKSWVHNTGCLGSIC